MATFYERFSMLLRQNNIKQQDISVKTGIDKTCISKYAHGKAIPDTGNLFRLAQALDVSPAWLSGEDVPMSTISYNGTDPLKQEISTIITQILNKTDDGTQLKFLKNLLEGFLKDYT